MAAADLDGSLDVLRSLSPGLHHASFAGYWIMIGRALPVSKTWASLPPAPCLSIVWGEGGAQIEHGGGQARIDRETMVWMEAGTGHRGTGRAGSDFATVFAPELTTTPLIPGLEAAPLHRDALAFVVRVSAAAFSSTRSVDAVSTSDRASLAELVAPLRARMPRPVVAGHLKRARAALESDVHLSTPVTALARLAGRSVPHLSRSFRDTWGIPASQYRKQLRLWTGTICLLEGQSVTASAASAGFADTAHFSRTFRAQYGVRPSTWLAAVTATQSAASQAPR